MRSYLFIALAVFPAACNNAAPVAQNSANANSAPAPSDRRQTVLSHTTENQPAANAPATGGAPGKWSAGGDPIDTAKFDGVIAEAEKAVKTKPNDEEAKKTLAQAYYDRGFALTGARQYASALGDYRRALKLDPGHEDSQKWVDQIVTIYRGLKKDPPKEGEEPPPLPFKKP